MPKRTISNGKAPLQPDCSDGAKMLIDQMKAHPEEFKGYAGKFTNLLDTARQAAQGLSRDAKMSARDAKAIIAAAEEHLYEVWLAEDVLVGIMQPKPEVEKAYLSGRGGGKSMPPPGSVITASTASNTTADHYDRVYQMEKEKYRMELERLRQQEHEYAMRNRMVYNTKDRYKF